MKKFLLFMSLFLVAAMAYTAYTKKFTNGDDLRAVNHQTTAAAPWKAGETILEGPCSVNEKTICYLKFLGTTTQGKALLQEFYASGQKATEPYIAILLSDPRERRRDGLYIEWHENGQKASEGHFQDGKLQGRVTAWHKNGQKKMEGSFQDGKEQGLWTWWHENGQKAGESHFQNGKEQGRLTLWHENGQKKLEGHFQDGKQQGLWTAWDENGNIVGKRNYD